MRKNYFNKKDHLWALYEYEQGIFKIPADARCVLRDEKYGFAGD